MKKNIRTKFFAMIINEIHLSYDHLDKILADKRLTNAEKKIIQCWNYLRKGQAKNILEIVETIETEYDDLVNAQKKLLTGISLIWEGNLKKALVMIKEATFELEEFEGIGNIYFIAVYNYFVCSLNLKNEKELNQSMNLLSIIPNLDEKQKITRLSCSFYFYNYFNDFKKARLCIKELEKVKDKMNDSIFMAYHTGKYMFYIKSEEYDLCFKVLDDIKKRRSFYSKSNYLFMRILLENFVNKTPIYAYERDFVDSPFLYNQIMVIKLLEESKPIEAKIYWNKLAFELPLVFSENFTYLGPKDIFSLCLKTHLKKDADTTFKLPEKKEDALILLLQKNNGCLSIETIYQKLWDEELLDKEDIGKLKKLVSRVRKNQNQNIKFKKGCYHLLKKVS